MAVIYKATPKPAGFAALLVALVVLAAACGSSSPDDEMAADQSSDESNTETSPKTNTGNSNEGDVSGDITNIDRNEGDLVESPSSFGEATGIIASPQIPGDEPNVVASALRGSRDNPLFGEPLVDLGLIISGGPPPDGIASIDWPNFEKASTVDWLEPQEAVIAVEIDGEPRAYPVRILISHEIVNDTIGTLPVTVTYCPLCNSAVAFERQADGRTFDFGTSGSLYNSALVMYDRQTESLWAHYTGQAIVGELVGTQLKLIPAATVSWSTFAAEHPYGLVLSRETGFGYSYGSNPYAGYDDPDTFPFLFLGTPDERLAAKERVLAIRYAGQEVAVVLDTLAEQGTLALKFEATSADAGSGSAGDNQDENTVEIVAFHQPGTATPLEQPSVALGRDVGATAVYLSEVDGQSLTFERVIHSELGYVFMDAETGSSWSLLGRAIDGPLQGARLTPVEHLDTFWFAISAYSPDVEIYGDR